MRIPWVISGVARTRGDLQDAMDATTRISVEQIKRYGLPPLALAGVVYERERRRHPLPGVERFQTALDAYSLGHADCDGLAPYRAAELIVRGIPARARVVESAGVGYHVVVTRPGRIVGGPRLVLEDPSAELGMLDGVGQYDDDAIESARQRRRRRGGALLKKAFSLAKKAGAGVTTPQRMVLAQSLATVRQADAMLSRDGPIPVPEPLYDEDA